MTFHDDKDGAQELLATGPQPGERYRYYKGGEYEVVCRSVREDTLEQLVTYRSAARGGVWTRTLENFFESVNGRPRFERVG
jgi:hypothetical protein